MKPVLLTLVLLALELFGLASAAAPQSEAPESWNVDRIDSYLASEVLKNGRVGLSVALVKDGKLALVKGYGRASLQENAPVQAETMFAIGSITKQFTRVHPAPGPGTQAVRP
jgi:CubicO group peptidase (beta-lactamase class C family)